MEVCNESLSTFREFEVHSSIGPTQKNLTPGIKTLAGVHHQALVACSKYHYNKMPLA